MNTNNEYELTPGEKKVIYELGGDLEAVARPYAAIGQKVGLSEEEVIGIIGRLKDRGILRRLGATLRHQLSGFTANAIAAWRVDPERIQEVGDKLARFQEVTHCYQRPEAPGWSKNLYTMIHAQSEEECRQLARRMSLAVEVTDYELLFSQEELKKTSMRYFP